MNRFKYLGSVLLVLSVALVSFTPLAGDSFQEANKSKSEGLSSGATTEGPIALTDEEHERQIEAFYSNNPQLQVVVDLKNPDGIDPELLPEDVRASLGVDEVVVAYSEFVNLDAAGGRARGNSKICLRPGMAITCATYSAGRDITTYKWWGGIKQFGRVVALRYDYYRDCSVTGNCKGWEIEKQYAWWERSGTSWTVSSAKMWTYFPLAQDYCTTADTSLNHSSNTFTPSWQSTYKTYVYMISGFPDKAYVASNHGYSYTRGDFYQSGTLKYNDARLTVTTFTLTGS